MNQPKQPRANKPNPDTQRLCREADESWKRQDYERGISLLDQATRLEPSNPGLHFNLALAHGARYNYAAVERSIENALQVSQGRVQMLEEAARICSGFKNVDLMLGYLERACRKDGASIVALTSLADIYILDDRFDEAAEIVARASRMDRKDPRVLLRDESVAKQAKRQTNFESS